MHEQHFVNAHAVRADCNADADDCADSAANSDADREYTAVETIRLFADRSETVNKQEKKRMCAGCRDNFYNGNNDLGVKECWNLSTAKVVTKRRVGLWESPPWNAEPEKVLSCRTEKGYVFVDKNQTR